ncbi:MAG: DUF4276 family protein [Chloroherpetonaceae bacterium]|nr:DUF4276 family protein [Chloroherpetonaceae bacterium]
MRVEFLLEEESMKNVLEILLPQILPDSYKLNENCFLRPHNGKSDLRKSISNKVKVFSRLYEPTKIVILHDQDSNDCKALKKDLKKICEVNGNCPVLIRIPCKELESWYLGDMEAIEQAYPRFKANKFLGKEKFRNPDLCQAAEELKKLIPNFQKGVASKSIPNYMSLEKKTSPSFKEFVRGVKKFLN